MNVKEAKKITGFMEIEKGRCIVDYEMTVHDCSSEDEANGWGKVFMATNKYGYNYGPSAFLKEDGKYRVIFCRDSSD